MKSKDKIFNLSVRDLDEELVIPLQKKLKMNSNKKVNFIPGYEAHIKGSKPESNNNFLSVNSFQSMVEENRLKNPY